MILRNAVLAVALVWLAFGLWMTMLDPTAFGVMIFPAILIAAIVFERVHYTGNAKATAPDADWQKTNERFLDEATGRPVTVWFNAKTGERKYVDE